MIKMSAKIDLLGGGATITSISSVAPPHQDAAVPIIDISNKKEREENAFILDHSYLDSALLVDNVNYFVGDQISDENGYFSPKIQFVISTSEPIDNITFHFGEKSGIFPTSLEIYDVGLFSTNDAVLTIHKMPPTTSLFVEIRRMNKPYSPLIITGLYTGVTIEIDERNLVSVEKYTEQKGVVGESSFGVYSAQQGQIVFNDAYGEVLDFAEALLLNANLPVVIYIENTLARNSSIIGEYITDKWNYDAPSKQVSVTIKDNLVQMQDISHEGYPYNPRNPRQFFSSGEDLYRKLYEDTPAIFKFLSFDELDAETKAVMSSINVNRPYLKKDNLWQQWNKLCLLCGTYIYKREDGRTVCQHTGGG